MDWHFNPFHATDLFWYPPENIRKPKVNNKNARTMCEICLKEIWRLSGLFIVNFEHVITG